MDSQAPETLIFHIPRLSMGSPKAWAVWSSGEWLRRKPFDVRHAVECMKLYWMCDSNGEAVGIPIPAGNNPQESWMKSMGNGSWYVFQECFQMNQPYPPKNDHISRLGKRKIIFKRCFSKGYASSQEGIPGCKKKVGSVASANFTPTWFETWRIPPLVFPLTGLTNWQTTNWVPKKCVLGIIIGADLYYLQLFGIIIAYHSSWWEPHGIPINQSVRTTDWDKGLFSGLNSRLLWAYLWLMP